jgi:hypothetical protein
VFGLSASGNSQWWSVMLSRTLDLKGHASGGLRNPSIFGLASARVAKPHNFY